MQDQEVFQRRPRVEIAQIVYVLLHVLILVKLNLRRGVRDTTLCPYSSTLGDLIRAFVVQNLVSPFYSHRARKEPQKINRPESHFLPRALQCLGKYGNIILPKTINLSGMKNPP